MVGPWRAARTDPLVASEAILSLFAIHDPTQEQRVGALLLGEALVKYLRG